MVQRIEFCTDLKLPEVVQADHFFSLRLGPRKRRQQDCSEKRDNRDDGQELDQREGRTMPSDRRAIPRVRDLVEHNWYLSLMSHPIPNTQFLISYYIITHCSCNSSKYYLFFLSGCEVIFWHLCCDCILQIPISLPLSALIHRGQGHDALCIGAWPSGLGHPTDCGLAKAIRRTPCGGTGASVEMTILPSHILIVCF